jgi:syntaxin-binding protein 1
VCNSGKNKAASSGTFDDESEYASSRYVPTLKSTCVELVSHQLSMEEFPSVVPMPDQQSSSGSAVSARRRGKPADSARAKPGATSKWNRTGNGEAVSKSGSHYVGGRNIVFMVGGISYSELRVVREVMEKESREIIVGSTSFLSPSEFLKDLASLTQS